MRRPKPTELVLVEQQSKTGRGGHIGDRHNLIVSASMHDDEIRSLNPRSHVMRPGVCLRDSQEGRYSTVLIDQIYAARQFSRADPLVHSIDPGVKRSVSSSPSRRKQDLHGGDRVARAASQCGDIDLYPLPDIRRCDRRKIKSPRATVVGQYECQIAGRKNLA